MAITVDVSSLGFTSDNATATTVAFTTGTAVAASGFIVVCVTWFESVATLSSVSGGSLTWAIDKTGRSTSNSAADCAVCSAQAPSGLASGTTITANFSGGVPGGRSIAGTSFTGVASSAALDTTSGPTNTNGTAWTSASTTILAGSLLIVSSYGINTNDTSTVTSPSIEAHDHPGAAGTFASTVCYRINAGAGATTVAGTWSGSEVGVVCAAAYKAAAGAAAGIPDLTMPPMR